LARILVIDDDREVRDSIGSYLRRAGHEVRVASNGREALNGVRKPDIDLVITDLNMPDVDGIEVINELRESTASAPVIAISGGGLIDKQLLLDNARMLGAVATLAKPFELSELDRAIRAALGSAKAP
jgi:DNA-binding response OmpR family regulator